jgi:hypothetical protein
MNVLIPLGIVLFCILGLVGIIAWESHIERSQ